MKLAAVLLLTLAPGLRAQGAAQSVRANPLPDLFAALVNLTVAEEVSASGIRVHEDAAGVDDTRITTLKAPWTHEFDVGSRHGTLRVAATAGLLLAEEGFELQTVVGDARVDQHWTVVATHVDVGWTRPLGAGWNLRPSLALALSYLDNDADYNSVAQTVIAPAIDGIYVNWDAWAVLGAASLTLEHPRDLERSSYGLSARYSAASADVFESTGIFEESSDTSQYLVLRGEVGGPSSWTAWGSPVRWDLFASWAGLYDVGHARIGFDELYEFGGGLALRPLPKLPGLRFGAALLTGPDVSGWTAGLSFAF